MSVKNTLSGNIIAHTDFRKGTLVDQSSNTNNGTFGSTPYWLNTSMGLGLKFDNVADFIDIGDTSASVKSIMFRIRADDISANTDYVVDLNGTDYITIVNGTVTVNGFAAATTAIYVNGIVATAIGNTTDIYHVVVTSDTAFSASDVDFARLEGTGFFGGIMIEAILFDNQPTAQQVSELYEESLQEAIVGTLPKRNAQYPELMAYNEFNIDGSWTKGTGWTIANGKASSDGSQAAVSDLKQSVGVVGKTYTIEYSVSNRSAGSITGLAGNATGTARSADGVYVDVIKATTDTDIGLQASADFVGDVDKINVTEGFKLNYRNTFEDEPVTVTALANGFLSDWQTSTGTWKVTDDGVVDWLENATSGFSFVPLLKSFGTWQWDINKAASSVMRLYFMSNKAAVSGFNGYEILSNSAEDLRLRKQTSGASNLFQTNSAAFIAGVKNTLRITRSDAGVFTVYLNGVLVDADFSGTNPVTSTTHSDSIFCVFDLDAGDKVTNFKFWDGVGTPSDLA